MKINLEKAAAGSFRSAAAQCLLGGLAVGLITFASFRFRLGFPTPTFLYLIVIVLLSLQGNFIASALVSFIAVGCLDYFFVTPLFSLRISEPIDVVAIVAFLTTSAVVTQLVVRVRQLMQEKLQRSEAYLSEAQSLSHTGSFGWKVATGEIVWSDETFRIFQYKPETKPTVELVLQRVHPEDALLVRQTIERASQDGNDFTITHRLLLPDGSVGYAHIAAHAKRDKAGEIEFVGAVMDITERKKADEALRKARADLAQVARLTTLGELTASIAHEVNQPLAAIVTNANASLRWLDHDPPDLGETRDAIRRIIRDGGRGSDVIARIRGQLKKEPALRERLDLNEVVRETIALAWADLQGVAVQTDLAPGLALVSADRIQLQQVLLNLAMNAIDAMKPVTDQARVLRIRTSDHAGPSILVAVQDSGIGLDPVRIEQLFETFYTTKPDGLGLGLSICRSIVEGYGGRLWAEPNPGPGATFQFTLPSVEADFA
jgi:signal transduction histidine kinase